MAEHIQCRHWHEFGPQCEGEMGHTGPCYFTGVTEWESDPLICEQCDDRAAEEWNERLRHSGGRYPTVPVADVYCVGADKALCDACHRGRNCYCGAIALSEAAKARRDGRLPEEARG